MHISINSLPAECNEPEHTVAINAQKKLFAKKKKKERNEKKKKERNKWKKNYRKQKQYTIATLSHIEVNG